MLSAPHGKCIDFGESIFCYGGWSLLSVPLYSVKLFLGLVNCKATSIQEMGLGPQLDNGVNACFILYLLQIKEFI